MKQKRFYFRNLEISFFNKPLKFFFGIQYGKMFFENNLFAICYTYDFEGRHFKIGFKKEYGITIYLGTFTFYIKN
jgi:hypothetical protein